MPGAVEDILVADVNVIKSADVDIAALVIEIADEVAVDCKVDGLVLESVGITEVDVEVELDPWLHIDARGYVRAMHSSARLCTQLTWLNR